MADKGLHLTNDELRTMIRVCTRALESLSDDAREYPDSGAHELYDETGALIEKLIAYADEVGLEDIYGRRRRNRPQRNSEEEGRHRHRRSSGKRNPLPLDKYAVVGTKGRWEGHVKGFVEGTWLGDAQNKAVAAFGPDVIVFVESPTHPSSVGQPHWPHLR